MEKKLAYPQIYLASSSPRRQELLHQIGVKFETLKVEVDETPLLHENPKDYVQRIAHAKAVAGWVLAEQQLRLPVLSADTIVVIDDDILGKPESREHAIAMLKKLSNRVHEVLTAITLAHQHFIIMRLVTTHVEFGAISDEQIEAYWLTGEPVDKAGAYALQGYAAAYIKHISGSYSGVVGLPLYETAELLRSIGI